MRNLIGRLCGEALLTVVLFASLALGADVKLAWDSNDSSEQVTKYTLYERVGSNYLKVSDVTPVAGTTQTHTITNVQPGRHVYICTASNVWGESGYSNEAITPNPNQPPKNLTWQIIITGP